MKTTNHLTATTFYNEFLDWLPRLEPFHSDEIMPVCPAKPDVNDKTYELSCEVVA